MPPKLPTASTRWGGGNKVGMAASIASAVMLPPHRAKTNAIAAAAFIWLCVPRACTGACTAGTLKYRPCPSPGEALDGYSGRTRNSLKLMLEWLPSASTMATLGSLCSSLVKVKPGEPGPKYQTVACECVASNCCCSSLSPVGSSAMSSSVFTSKTGKNSTVLSMHATDRVACKKHRLCRQVLPCAGRRWPWPPHTPP
eukprot:scaffold795_cov375-Prasinococcus_capsulatus_cf.AAC.23